MLDRTYLPYKYRYYEFSATSLKAYKEFKKENKDIDISKTEYDKIIRTQGTIIADEIIATGFSYKPPRSFPPVKVMKYRPKQYRRADGTLRQRRSIDWQKTKIAGKKIYHLNSHSDGYITNFKVGKGGAIQLNDYWMFKGCRYSNRALSIAIKSEDRYRLLGNYEEQKNYRNDV